LKKIARNREKRVKLKPQYYRSETTRRGSLFADFEN